MALSEGTEMSKVYQGRPRAGEKRPTPTVVRFTINEDMKDEDIAECERLDFITARSGNVNMAKLYRTMRELWYSLPVSERREFVKQLEQEDE